MQSHGGEPMTTPSAAIPRVSLDRRTIAEIGLLAAILATLFVVQVGLYGLAPTGAVASHPPALSQAQAISIARTHVAAGEPFVSADAGPLPALYPSDRQGPDNPLASDQQARAASVRTRSGPDTV